MEKGNITTKKTHIHSEWHFICNYSHVTHPRVSFGRFSEFLLSFLETVRKWMTHFQLFVLVSKLGWTVAIATLSWNGSCCLYNIDIDIEMIETTKSSTPDDPSLSSLTTAGHRMCTSWTWYSNSRSILSCPWEGGGGDYDSHSLGHRGAWHKQRKRPPVHDCCHPQWSCGRWYDHQHHHYRKC